MRTAVVTGAAKPDSIGHEVALRLLKEGMQVVVADLYEEGFAALKQCFGFNSAVSVSNGHSALLEGRSA